MNHICHPFAWQAGRCRARGGAAAALCGLALWATAVLLFPSSSNAESAGQPGSQPVLAPGARIRVSSPLLGKDALVGRLVAMSGDTLSFASDRYSGMTTRLLLDRSTRVEMSIARHNRPLEGLLCGGLTGLGIGTIVVAIHQVSLNRKEGFLPDNLFGGPAPPHETASNTPMFVGLGAGAVLGTLLGALERVDTWAPAGLPRPIAIRASSAGAAGFRVGVMVSR